LLRHGVRVQLNAAMHYVQIPASIRLRDQVSKVEGETVSFQRYAHDLWLNDARWETPKTNLLRLMVVLPLLGRAPGEWVELEDQDWVILKSIIDMPGVGSGGAPTLYSPLVQIQVGPTFERAILDSPTKDPRAVLNGAKEDHGQA
jgi:hypothetical protein